MTKKYQWKKRLQQSILLITGLCVLLGLTILIINQRVESIGEKYVYSPDSVPEADAILILGAYVFPDGTVSTMLHDRLTAGYDLYTQGKAPKIIVSGDHGRQDYDEVNSMKAFLINQGVPVQDIFMDHAGFSTYESVYRARDIFQVRKVILVTQEYHLLRAVFDARELGLEAYGVASDLRDYGQVIKAYKTREIIARNKDFIWAKIIQPKPTFLGETIPVTGDGRSTDDR